MRKFDVVYASCPFGGLPPNVSIAASGGVPYGSPKKNKEYEVLLFLFCYLYGLRIHRKNIVLAKRDAGV